MKRFLILVMVLASTGAAFSAEDPNTERGVQPGKAYHIGEIDQINVFNGHVNATIPIGQAYHVNGGMTYGFTLHFNSYAWEIGTRLYSKYVYPDGIIEYRHNYSYPSLLANAGFGWTLSLGSIDLDPNGGCQGCYSLRASRGSDGAQHDFYPALHNNNDTQEALYDSQSEAGVISVGYTNDGTYLREKVHQNTDNSLWYEIDFPDGSIHKFNAVGRLTEMADQFGNRVTVEYLAADVSGMSSEWRLREFPAGAAQYTRENRVYFQSAPNVEDVAREIVAYFDLAAFNNTRAIYTLGYSSSAGVVSRPCTPTDLPPDITPDEGPTVNIQTLVSVSQPDSSGYSMVYDVGNQSDCSDKFAGGYPGTLTSIAMPTGGSIAYEYQLYHFPQALQQRGQGYNYVPGIKKRVVKDFDSTEIGFTEYSPVLQGSSPPARELVNTVTETSHQQVISRTRNYFGACAVYQGSNEQIPPSAFQFCISSGEYGLPFTHDVAAHPAVDGRFLSSEVFEPSPTGDILKRSTYVRYEADGTMYLDSTSSVAGVSFINLDANRRLASSNTRYFLGNVPADGYRDAIEDLSEFDGLGHYRKTDAVASSGWGAARTSYTLFNPSAGSYTLDSAYKLLSGFVKPATTSRWILDTYTTQYVLENGHSAATYSCFDSFGSLTRRRTLVADNPSDPKVTPLSASDLVAVFAADSFGNTTQEEYRGGDVALDAPTTGYSCTSTFPPLTHNSYAIQHAYQFGSRKSSVYLDAADNPLSFKLLDVDIDASTGYVSKARERADGTGILSTTFNYDAMGRLTAVTPDSSVTQGARVSNVYLAGTATAPAKVTTTTKSANGTTTLKTQSMTFDGLGRLTRETSETPETPTSIDVSRVTEYNHLGWKLRVSELEPSTWAAEARHYTVFTYDYAGRPVKVTAPDGKSTTFAYSGVSTTKRTVNIHAGTSAAAAFDQDVTTQEDYDREGRLIAVTEPSGTLTTYSYDVGGRLSTVCMNQVSGTCGQQRSFVYDNRGFLKQETHPEKGASGNGTTYYDSYDARGHVGSRYDEVQAGSSNISFVYDRAERLERVKETNGGRPLKIFTYGDANVETNGIMDFRNGQLLTATRFNWFNDFHLNVEITESYDYRGTDGRVSSRTTRDYECDVDGTTTAHCVEPGAGVLKRTFSQDFAYDNLGSVATAGYPSVVFSNCGTACPTAPFAPTVTNSYSHGFLTGVQFPHNGGTFANSLTYHPSGMVATVAHSNGVTDTIAADPNGMARPLSISTAGSTDAGSCTAPSITSQPSSVSIASGTPTTLTVAAVGDSSQSHPLEYQWYIGSSGVTTQPITGATLLSYSDNNPTTTTSYWVRVRNGCGTPADSATAVVTVCVHPTISGLFATYPITRGQSATLAIAATGDAISIQWYRGPLLNVANPIVGATGTSVIVSPAVTTTYWARVTSSCGTANSIQATVTVSEPPTPPTWIIAESDGFSNRLMWGGATPVVADILRFEVERASDGQPYAVIQWLENLPMIAYFDHAVTPGKAYAYRMVTVDRHGFRSAPSVGDATVVMTFPNHPVIGANGTAPPTLIKAVHVSDLRHAINAMRTAAGLPLAWQSESVTGVILASHFIEMRTYLDEARSVLLLPQMIYTYQMPDQYHSTIHAADVNDLLRGVQ